MSYPIQSCLQKDKTVRWTLPSIPEATVMSYANDTDRPTATGTINRPSRPSRHREVRRLHSYRRHPTYGTINIDRRIYHQHGHSLRRTPYLRKAIKILEALFMMEIICIGIVFFITTVMTIFGVSPDDVTSKIKRADKKEFSPTQVKGIEMATVVGLFAFAGAIFGLACFITKRLHRNRDAAWVNDEELALGNGSEHESGVGQLDTEPWQDVDRPEQTIHEHEFRRRAR